MRGRWKLCLVLFVLLLSVPAQARADMGPKPSVRISFTGDCDEVFYGTLLSEKSSTGPASAWDGVSEYSEYHREFYGDAGYDIWQAFLDYRDADGFYFLQEWWECSDGRRLDWTYYPPSTFKVLLYFPESGDFYTSGICETYAFDSYFTVDLAAVESEEPGALLEVRRDYDYTWELVSLAARMALTVFLELLLALLFGYREKKALLFLGLLNVATQAALNIFLNMVNYYSGPMAFTGGYILAEVIVCAVEIFFGVRYLPGRSAAAQKSGKIAGYVLAANILSFGVGLWLAHVIPGIF